MTVERIYKGATRPALMLGVPLVAGIWVAIGSVIAVAWLLVLAWWLQWPLLRLAAFLVAGLAILALAWMRQATRKDDQRIHQLWMAFKLNWLWCRNRRLWGGCRSYSPIDYRDRED